MARASPECHELDPFNLSTSRAGYGDHCCFWSLGFSTCTRATLSEATTRSLSGYAQLPIRSLIAKTCLLSAVCFAQAEGSKSPISLHGTQRVIHEKLNAVSHSTSSCFVAAVNCVKKMPIVPVLKTVRYSECGSFSGQRSYGSRLRVRVPITPLMSEPPPGTFVPSEKCVPTTKLF
jgi:hypothetical protein